MRDQDRDAPGIGIPVRGSCVTFEQRVFSFRIERGGRFIQNQQQWFIAHETPRKCELLPLAK